MTILITAKSHFDSDIIRARELTSSSTAVPTCADDMLRAGFMFAVGACDAFFADSYADLISRVLRAKEIQPAIALPGRLNNLRIPVTTMLRVTEMPGWRWRMAARELVEKENVLSFEQIKTLFNQFFPKKEGLLSQERVFSWLSNPSAKRRFFGATSGDYAKVSPADQNKFKAKILQHFELRYAGIFQRRHDCIHCCDRPKNAVQSINLMAAQKKIEEVVFLVNACHRELEICFPIYLAGLGFNSTTRNRVSL